MERTDEMAQTEMAPDDDGPDASAPAPVPPDTQRSPVGQSPELWQASWQREKTQTRGVLQSLLSEQDCARPTCAGLLLQLAAPAETMPSTSAAQRTARTELRARDMRCHPSIEGSDSAVRELACQRALLRGSPRASPSQENVDGALAPVCAARRREGRLRVLRIGDPDRLAAEALGDRDVIDAVDP